MLVDDEYIAAVNIPEGVQQSSTFTEFTPQLKNVNTEHCVSKLASV
jgi:hypothetical protein